MSESSTINLQAFQPFDGGRGKRLAVTAVSSASVAIPGLEGGINETDKRRVLVTNGGDVSAFIRFGRADVVATTDCLELLAGSGYLLTPPFVGPSAVWLAAITESDTTSISVCSGQGT